jgi:hypothetical protein
VNIMKLVSGLIGLAALSGVAFSSGAASAQTSTVVVPTGYVCNEWGHCWHRHYYGGYYHPHYWGGYGWHRHWGYGYGWQPHYWHRHYWGGGGYGWHHWHYWHRWHQW